MPPKTKAPKIRWRGGGSRVDEELDAVDYADNYDDEYEAAPVVAKPKPVEMKPAPKPAEKPAAPKPVEKIPERRYEENLEFLEKPIVLETYDDWETAMDELDKKMTKEEEERAKQRQSKK
jgi:hypothetical protein